MDGSYNEDGKSFFRVYAKRKDGKERKFIDYELRATDIKVKIVDDGFTLKNTKMYGPELDWSDKVLGKKNANNE